MEVSSQMGPFSIVPEWVLDRGLSPTALKLYIVMARFADWNTGMAFPSRETLADRMGCSTKTVDRAVIEVVAAECVDKISRGRYASALYRVYQVDPRKTHMSSEQTDMSSEGTDLSSRSDKNDHLTRTTELEPLEQQPLNDIKVQFNEWWAVYPRRRGKGEAAKAFAKALEKTTFEHLLAMTVRFADDPHRPTDFTPLPSTWLNQERWDDDPYEKPDRDKTNSERNIENLRASMALLETKKEVEHGQNGNESVTDFGVNLRSAEGI